MVGRSSDRPSVDLPAEVRGEITRSPLLLSCFSLSLINYSLECAYWTVEYTVLSLLDTLWTVQYVVLKLKLD